VEHRGQALVGVGEVEAGERDGAADAAALLHVHPNTLRHRVRRAADLSLDDPEERLVALLQLRLTTASAPLWPGAVTSSNEAMV
jgi:hypothetical protein